LSGRLAVPKFRLDTPSGSEEDVSPERIADALRAADRDADAGAFAVVTRDDDGVFVQLASEGALEVGGTGDLPHRLDHATLARGIVERLARGEEPWGDLPHWDTAAQRALQEQGRDGSRFRGALALLALVLLVAALIWFALRPG
jgi:hypothetical protein